uniref:Putative ccr4-not transcription complex subunit 6-like protein n=1 Tax=Xenopsylla cheopis TaxID=163159 RepID=A0A6M2DKG9_XENCH
MSPSSHGGNLHVERYIGSCLISQLARPGPKSSVKHGPPTHFNYPLPNMSSTGHGFQGPPGWSGMPMISMSRQRTRKTAEYEDCSLSRLAMHTQGAPLILSGRYRRSHNNNNNNGNANLNQQQQYHHHQQIYHQHPHNHHFYQQQNRSQQTNCTNSELSTRDEGNNNSSKANIDTVSVVSDESSGSANSESYIPRIIKPRKRRKKDRKPVMIIANNSSNISNCNNSTNNGTSLPTTTITPVRSPPNLVDDSANGSNTFFESKTSIGPKTETSDEPRLHHEFSELQEEDNSPGAPSDCQCRYCDPSGQIWDAGQLCYSLFLTPPAALRRSWSEDAPACPVPAAGVIGAGRSAAKSTWRAAPIEVSSEIVTSLNGLRDLEIRFFSHKDDSEDYSPADTEKGSDVFLCSGALCSI